MSPTRMSKIESGIRIVLDFIEHFNHRDVAALLELVSEDCVFESSRPSPDGTANSGTKALREVWEQAIGASTNARVEVEEIFGAGIRCVVRWRYLWTDTGGKDRHIRGVGIVQVRNGRISQILSYTKAS